MKSLLYQSHTLSINDLSWAQIEQVLSCAKKLDACEYTPDLLDGKVIASCFFEPSTRTRLSFESAICRLKGQVIGFSDAQTTSSKKGESLADSIRMLSAYSDLIILRHPNAGSSRLASEHASVPVINAGDGGNQHPTQTLLDLFSIQQCQGTLEGLHIALTGDLKYGRTVHSLVQAACHFKPRLYFVSPESLAMPDEICKQLREAGVSYSFHNDMNEVINQCDILYMTRLQKERFEQTEYQLLKQQWVLTPEQLKGAKDNLRILHPLPRAGEIDPAVDSTQHAYYFEQARHGLTVRKALLALTLHKELNL